MFCICLIVRPGSNARRHRILQYLSSQELLYPLEQVDVLLRHQCYCYAVALSTGSTPYAMNVILHVVGHVIVDDHQDVVYVNTTGNDVCCHEHVNLASLETVHHLVTLCLRKV